MSPNPNLFYTSGDEIFGFGVLGNHLNQRLTNQMNHQPMFSSNNQMSHVFNNHSPQDPNSMDYRMVSSTHLNYDFGKYGNMLACVKQEPTMVLSSTSGAASSSSFGCSRNSRVYPSFGSNNQFELGKRVAQHMRRGLVSAMQPRTQVSSSIDYFPIKDNPHMTRVSISETITKQYSAVIPSSTMLSVQNNMERVERALACESNGWHSPANHVILSPNLHREQNIDHGHTKHGDEILSVKPLSMVFPKAMGQNPYPSHRRGNHLDNLFSQSHKVPMSFEPLNFSTPPNLHDNPRPKLRKRGRNTKKIEDIAGYFFNYSDDEEEEEIEDDAYDGRTHSLPYEKYGPYTCPKCNNVFDTSQKFAAHMVSVHYRNETSKEKRKRLRARYKKQIRLLNPEMQGAKLDDISVQSHAREGLEKIDPEVKVEERVAEEDGEGSKGTSNGDSLLFDVVVKQESM